jgi:CHAT domain-containing protein
MTGWAERFVAAGAGAFIGSLWEVRDTRAAIFAREFYASLVGGVSLGEAVANGREAIKNEAGDPTWLSYAVYGDSAATIV